MRLHLKNIGMVKQADIDISGLCVITGANDTGKSTIGKILYSIYYGLNDCINNIEEYKLMSIRREIIAIERLFSLSNIAIPKELASIRYVGFNNINIQQYTTYLNELAYSLENRKRPSKEKRDEIRKHINTALDKVGLEADNSEFKKYAINLSLNTEFNGQINNVFLNNEGEIKIYEGKKQVISLTIVDNQIKSNPIIDDITFKDATLLDSTVFFRQIPKNLMRRGYTLGHYEDLANKIFNRVKRENIVDEFFNKQAVEIINKYFFDVITGKLELDSSGRYSYLINGKRLNIENLATGLKAFSVLKILFDNGYINSDSLLIIDEPEVHLHPKWQIILAELVVLLATEIGINILLTSHSPYFIEAIEVFSKKYRFKENTKFYLAMHEDNEYSVIADVSNDLQKTYKMLSEPFQQLENISSEYDNDEC